MEPPIKIYRQEPEVQLPTRGTAHAAGFDVRAWLPPEQRAAGLWLAPGERTLVPTGLRFELPMGWEMQIRPRSGLALKHGVTLVNTPGTLDADYRGELKIIIINHGTEDFHLTHQSRMAQLVFQKLPEVSFQEVFRVSDLEESHRGEGGFGHTGLGDKRS